MANDEEVLASTVREYFVKHGGKVKRDDLFDHFRSQLDKFDDQGTSKNRFGDIVDSLASLQNVEGEKYFVLKNSRNGTTPVLMRRQGRHLNQRKDKGVSLPASMRNFRFSEDALWNLKAGDSKIQLSPGSRRRSGLRSESHGVGMRRNTSDTLIVKNAQANNDSGVDTSVSSSLQSESPKRLESFSKNSEFDPISQHNTDTGMSYIEDDQYEHDVPSHVLTAFEKSWMLSTMTGNRAEIVCHIAEDPRILEFKGFIWGTALHWAAKQGSGDIVKILIEGGASVNVKSGYTPLHLATMHGKDEVIGILVDEYNANVHLRDHSGKEPKDVATKRLSQQLKLKLEEPEASNELEERGKKSEDIRPDSSNASGLSKYMEQKEKLKPKLKTGASFRFLKKPKKARKSERPVIEHWDSSRQERLESTLQSDEKEIYQMQRTNSGSLFPTSFYTAKKSNHYEVNEEKSDSVDAAPMEPRSNTGNSRPLSVRRSHSEGEFRNLARISESDPQESLEAPMASPVLPSDLPAIKKVSSEKNLNRSASFQDELATRLTMPDVGRPRPGFTGNESNLKQAGGVEEDLLRLKLDESTEERHVDVFKGEELATFMTVPERKSGLNEKSKAAFANARHKRDDKMASAAPDAQPYNRLAEVSPQSDYRPFGVRLKSAEMLPSTRLNTEENSETSFRRLTSQAGRKPSPDDQVSQLSLNGLNARPNGDLTTLGNLKKNPSNSGENVQHDLPLDPRTVHSTGELRPKFNDDYKQLSDMLAGEEQLESSQEQPASPKRPPRRKDKKTKVSSQVDIEGTTCDIDASKEKLLTSKKNPGAVSTSRNESFYKSFDYSTKRGGPPHKLQAFAGARSRPDYEDTEVYSGLKNQPSASVDDFRIGQFSTSFDATKASVRSAAYGQDFTKAREHSRRKSDGFAMQNTYSDEDIFEHYSRLSARRNSDGVENITSQKFHDFKAVGIKVMPDSFANQDEVSFKYPRGVPNLTQESEFASRESEGSNKQERPESLIGIRKPDGFSGQKEASPDHHQVGPNKKQEALFSRRKSEGFIDQQSSEFTARHANGFSNERHVSPGRFSLGYTRISHENVVDRGEANNLAPPPYSDIYRVSPPYSELAKRDWKTSQDDFSSGRVLPPYRPPLEISNQGKQGIPRSDCTLTSQANVRELPPYRLHYIESVPCATLPDEVSVRPSDNSSNKSVSQSSYSLPTDPTPIPPPRKHRKSVSSEDHHPSEISPVAPPRKSKGAIPSIEESCNSFVELPFTAPPRKHGNNTTSGDFGYSLPQSSFTVPSPNQRGSLLDSNPPLLSQSLNLPQPPLGNREYTHDREMSSGHRNQPFQNYESDVINADNSARAEFSTQPTSYEQSVLNQYFPANNRQPTRSSEYCRSEGNEYEPTRSSSSINSTPHYLSDSDLNYPSGFSSNFNPTVEGNHVDSYDSRPTSPLSAVDITSRGQSPPDEVIVAKIVMSEDERFTNHPGEFRTERREPSEDTPTQKSQELVLDRFNLEGAKGEFDQAMYDHEYGAVLQSKYEDFSDSNAVSSPKYEGYADASAAGTPTNVSEMEKFLEPEFIVAKEMSTREPVAEARPVERWGRDNLDTLPATLGHDGTNKSWSNSSDASSESSESRNKYRLTSMI